ncbi:MAG: segregation/condensation protein A [Leptolyngbyaceae bacterium]|nr:segregation/condensation protein A [Leptolyngbyaceae bacterium]
MAISLAQNAIALLIDLAERGEIDPWDVKVIDVIDRFLSQLKPGQNSHLTRTQYESELSESGQAILYASMLVLLKADSLARSDEAEEQSEFEEDSLFALDQLSERPLPSNLERQIRRRTIAQPPQRRRVTLHELIEQLEVMATALTTYRPRMPKRRSRPQPKSKAVRAITQLAHQENLSEIAEALEQVLKELWPEISQDTDWLEFEALLDLWSMPDVRQKIGIDEKIIAHHPSPHGDRVGIFWALLFLSSQSKVELQQNQFYQDLHVRSLSVASEQSSGFPDHLNDLAKVVVVD